MKWLMSIRDEIFRDGLILERADIYDALTSLEVSVLDIDSVGIVEDNLQAPNIVSMEKEIARLKKRISIGLKNIEMHKGDSFVMHFGVRIVGMNKKLERVIPFHLVLEDGQSITLLVDNTEPHEDFNKNKPVEIKHIVINKKDVTNLILSNGDEDISTIAKRLATILDNTHARFIKKDDTLKKIDNYKLTLSIAWQSETKEDSQYEKDKQEFISKYKDTAYENYIMDILPYIEKIDGDNFYQKLDTYFNIGSIVKEVIDEQIRLKTIYKVLGEDRKIPKADKNIYNVVFRSNRYRVTAKVGKKWTKEEKDYIRDWLNYYMVNYVELDASFVIDDIVIPERYPTKKELKEMERKKREEENRKKLQAYSDKDPLLKKAIDSLNIESEKAKVGLYKILNDDITEEEAEQLDNMALWRTPFGDKLYNFIVDNNIKPEKELDMLSARDSVEVFREWFYNQKDNSHAPIDKYLQTNDMMKLVEMLESDKVIEGGKFSDEDLEKINNHLFALNMKAKEELGL